MSSINKPQRRFLLVLFPLLMCLRGRVNFRNISRYSDYHQKTFSQWYRRNFDFTELNRLSLQSLSEETATTSSPPLIAALCQNRSIHFAAKATGGQFIVATSSDSMSMVVRPLLTFKHPRGSYLYLCSHSITSLVVKYLR